MIKDRVVERTISETICDDCGKLISDTDYECFVCFVCRKDLCYDCKTSYIYESNCYDDEINEYCCKNCRKALESMDKQIEVLQDKKETFIKSKGVVNIMKDTEVSE